MNGIAVVLLAAGKGTRMKSKKQKILHEVGGKPMVQHAFDAAAVVATIPPVLVIAPDDDGVPDLLGSRASYVIQAEQMGTGHATLMARELLRGRVAQTIVTYGDMPLLKADTLQQMAETQTQTGAAIAMLTVRGDITSSFGRVVRDEQGQVKEIVEVAEARRRPNTAEILSMTELNVGVYCFDSDWLWVNLDKLPLRQARTGPEYYLTDMVELAVSQGRGVMAIMTDDPSECLGAGTRAEMVDVERAFRQRAVQKWLAHGVTIVDPATTYIDPDVIIGQDTVIWPNSYLQGHTVIGEDCHIGPNAILRNATVRAGSRVEQEKVIGKQGDSEELGVSETDKFPSGLMEKEQQELLFAAARLARLHAYAPYSHYPVSAAILAEDGRIFTGVNVENASYGLTVCAERIAIFKAVSEGVRRILAVVVITENGGSPCGACRQVISEFASDIPVWLGDAQGNMRQTTLYTLLPDHFGPEHLTG
ncbi:MAG: cytidine deaminase [Chloroflexi bacterium]|nr:cytidine deaminase [Chloroflexota bacterium]MBP8058723.1 cytidine deaminase [Chloroflexota bacterium]